MDVIEKLRSAKKGDDYDKEKYEVAATAGIHLFGHGNAIEIHAEKLEEAQALRDLVLDLIENFDSVR